MCARPRSGRAGGRTASTAYSARPDAAGRSGGSRREGFSSLVAHVEDDADQRDAAKTANERKEQQEPNQGFCHAPLLARMA